ncbi:MAG TPA: hypothetical protein VG225_17770 [Terracidiphilus sp.]|jgi:hypothetical protein|nr:hypothetical protein [Terracidiphilus sp.]
MAAARKRSRKPVKVTDEVAVVRCAAGIGLIREERWDDAQGDPVRYNLAFINFHLFSGDKGRVLGYDTAHGRVHRHFAGHVEMIEPASYSEILSRFMAEVETLKMRKAPL